MAAHKRVCITVDEETLRLADREAHRLNISRNDFIRAAVRAEVNSVATQKEHKRRQQHRATAGVRNIVKKAGM
jgi:metal-responsive CopG/Arc/MetJ family transcriptional regulator